MPYSVQPCASLPSSIAVAAQSHQPESSIHENGFIFGGYACDLYELLRRYSDSRRWSWCCGIGSETSRVFLKHFYSSSNYFNLNILITFLFSSSFSPPFVNLKWNLIKFFSIFSHFSRIILH